jgi:uncharacterized protein YbjT (DUF2867 family)
MSRTVRVVGGEAAVARTLVEAGEELEPKVDVSVSGDLSGLGPDEALVDLGLPPREWPAGDALVTAERDRAAAIATTVGDGRRVVRISILGAAADAAVPLLAAQAAAEETLRSSAADVVALRVGLVLGDCGLSVGLRDAMGRMPILPLPAVERARLEPLALADLGRYAIAAAVGAGPFAERYELGCGEVFTGGLYARGLADNLGVRRLVLSSVLFPARLVAPLYASPDFPVNAVVHQLEALRRGLRPKGVGAWEDFDIRPVELRIAMAAAAGMTIPLRSGGEGRFSTWKKPEKKGILWTKPRRR